MKYLIIPSLFLVVACGNQTSDNTKQMEALNNQMQQVSAEYQRHLAREMQWATAPEGEAKENALDSFRKLDTQYVERMDKIKAKMDSLSTIRK